MIKIKSRKIAAFAVAAMMAASITPAMAAPSFASEDNTEATTASAEEIIEETEEAVAEPETVTAEPEEAIEESAEVVAEEPEDVAAEEPQQENVISAKGSMKAMAATSPGQATTISFGQRVTGSFSKDQTSMTHYYKFRTSSASGVSYTFKAGFLSYNPDYPNDGLNFGMRDGNYNNVFGTNGSYYMYLPNGITKNITYNNLKPNTYYYVWAENPWTGINAKSYSIEITSSGNSGTTTPTTTPSLVAPTLTLDKTRVVTENKSNVYVSGKVSYACGQLLGVYNSEGKILYNYVQLGNSKSRESFRIQVPARFLVDGENAFVVRVLAINQVINCSNGVNLTVKIGKDTEETNNKGTNSGSTNSQNHKTIYPVYKVTVNGSVYEILQNKEVGEPAARLVKAKNARSVTVPASIKYKNTHYDVKGIQPGAFAGSNAKTVTIKTRMLSKASVKNCLNGSSVKTIKVKTVNKKLSKSFVKKYKKFFTKSNCGKKVKVKR